MASLLLACPLCAQPGFQSLDALRDGLVSAASRHVVCPVCGDALPGLDKFTLHLFSHARRADGATQTDESLHGFARLDAPRVAPFPPARDRSCLGENLFSERVPRRGDGELEMDRNVVDGKEEVDENYRIPSGVADARLHVRQDGSSAPELVAGPVGTAARFVADPEGALLEDSKPAGRREEQLCRCGVCGFCFSEPQILAMHQQLVHPRRPDGDASENQPDDKRQHACHLCSKSFKMRGSLMVHLRVAHSGSSMGKGQPHKTEPASSTEEKRFACPSCSKTFKKEHQLGQHLKTHEGKQWECDICCKLFTTKYFLKKHKRLHTGEMPYACGVCGKTFTFQQSYHKHLLYHSDDKPHVCSHCERAFKELSTLHNHQRIHTGEKPFACETCGKCFRQRVSYLVHRRIHTGAMPYKCSACDRSFRYKVSQRTHKCTSATPGVLVRQPGALVARLQHQAPPQASGETGGDRSSSAETQDQARGAAAASTGPPRELGFPSSLGDACNAGGLPRLANTEAAGRKAMHLPATSTRDDSSPAGCLVGDEPRGPRGGGSENTAAEQNRLFVETSDFFSMVMSPCLLSPSERLRYLSLSPPPDTRATAGGGEAPCPGEVAGGPGALETINEESLRLLLYGPSTS
ncbi:zinc finger protein 184-like [Bacillus rossius redtenbacheri]|uniref:zinc finger protein 184-like n=1 Tax=Bacillus rossius redtenbacheri TaxID=93214 RepID=UPI002FDE7A71